METTPFEEARDDERAQAGLDSERLRQIAEWLSMEHGHEETAKRVSLIADRHDRLAERLTAPPSDDCNCAPGIDGVVIHNSWAHTPPTNDEREALARILDESDPEMGGVVADEGHESWEWYLPQVDAVLAAGYRRQGPITDEREALTASIRASYAGSWDAEGTPAYERAAAEFDTWLTGFRRQGPITDAQVEAAIRRYWWTNPEYVENGNVREAMRAALEAALAADRSE